MRQIDPGERDCYDMAKEWNTKPEDAASRMKREGWIFQGYNDYGEESYLPPKDKEKK